MTPQLIPLVMAAKAMALSEATLRRYLRSGRARGIRYGRDWMIPWEEVRRLAEVYPLEKAVKVSGVKVEDE
jgi:hypothetical protein